MTSEAPAQTGIRPDRGDRDAFHGHVRAAMGICAAGDINAPEGKDERGESGQS
jgi:hypothetical protein